MTPGRRTASVPLVSVLALLALAAAGCRVALDSRPAAGRGAQAERLLAAHAPLPAPGAAARGAALYAAYCAGCHGADGRGVGPVAAVLDLRPPDLTAPGVLAGVADRALVDRLLAGTPLRAALAPDALAEAVAVEVIVGYLPSLATADWTMLRAGRIAYENTCSPCHGVHGRGEGILGGIAARPAADLVWVRDRYPDTALVALAEQGVGAMPRALVDPAERRALVAWVRHLSDGQRLYDTYCATCHGDDGRGVHPEDLLPPATGAPPLDLAMLARLTPAEARARAAHMLARERGFMPHFRGIVAPGDLADVVTYLRTLR